MHGLRQRAVQFTVARYAVFLTLYCLYLRYRITPSIDYEAHPNFPVFYSNVAFLREFLDHPGGPMRYVSGFLGLAYHSPWGGPLLLTVLVGLVCWATDVLILAMGGRFRGLAFGPGIILLVAFNRLMGQPTALVALLAALLSLVFYLGLAGGGDGRRIGVFLVVGAFLHWVAGGPFLLFALLVGLYELLVKRRRLPALVGLLSMEAIPYLGATYLYVSSLAGSFCSGLPTGSAAGPVYVLAACYLYFPLLMIGLAVWRFVSARRARAAEQASSGGRPAWVHSLAGSVAILVIGAAAAVFSYDANVHRVLVVDDAARRGDWERVLREAGQLPVPYYTDVVSQHVNEALYHTGRLGDAMFAYPQFPDRLMVDQYLGSSPGEQAAKMERRSGLWFQIGDLDLQLGLVNEAENEAYEALAIHGPHPEVLKRLALINLVKRQPDAARVFLNVLRGNPVYAPWADEVLRRMAADPYLPADPYVRSIRAVRFTRDRTALATDLPVRCWGLLEDNPDNRMAFEYLMAVSLLKTDLTGFEQELPRMRALGYRRLPTHYQEAVLLYERATMRRSERGGYPISPEILQNFADFSQALQATGGDPLALAARFGDTYFFYNVFGMTGSMVAQ